MISFTDYQIEQANLNNDAMKSDFVPGFFDFSYLFTQDRESYIENDYYYDNKAIRQNIFLKSITNFHSSIFISIEVELDKANPERYQNDEGFLISAPIGQLDNDGLKKRTLIKCKDLIEKDIYQLSLKFIPDRKGQFTGLIFPTANNASVYSSWSACQVIDKGAGFIQLALSLSSKRPNFSDAKITLRFDPSLVEVGAE
jgi:hypothetical protein